MSKKIIALIIIFIGMSYWVYQSIINKPPKTTPLNTTYTINGEDFTLLDGKIEKEIVLGAASKIKINVFEANTQGDINNNGLDDTVILLTYNAGGSGTFFYVALALQEEEGYKGTNAVLIGDRITPQTTNIVNGTLIVNYTDRYPWESFSTEPSIDKSKHLTFKDQELKEVAGEILSQDIAHALVIEKWGDCTLDTCEKLTVNILDVKDKVGFVQAVYDGLRDDSVQAQKKIGWANYLNNAWELGSIILTEHKCQLNRGHQEFSNELCL